MTEDGEPKPGERLEQTALPPLPTGGAIAPKQSARVEAATASPETASPVEPSKPVKPATRQKPPRIRQRRRVNVVYITGLAFLIGLATLIAMVIILADGTSSGPSLAGESVSLDTTTGTSATAPTDSEPGSDVTMPPLDSESPATEVLDRGLGVPLSIEGVTSWTENEVVWNVTVGALEDITSQVMAQNVSNQEPPDGFAFVGFDVDLQLASASDGPTSIVSLGVWEIVGGATGRLFDTRSVVPGEGCGDIGSRFDRNGGVFPGGRLAGTVCIPLPVEDLQHPETSIVFNTKSGERYRFVEDGPAPAIAPVIRGQGIDVLGPAFPLDQPATLTVESLIRTSPDHRWKVTMGRLRDTSQGRVPDGLAWASFDVEVEILGSSGEILTGGLSMDWEVIGGATLRAYDGISFDVDGCGNDERFEWLAQGDVFNATICIPVPIVDLDHPDTRLAVNSLGTRFTFADE